jgi:GH43 family beta-xylosidase
MDLCSRLLAIIPGGAADPWMVSFNNVYYLTYTTGGDVRVSQSSDIGGPWPAQGVQVYSPTSGQGDVWAPELHQINGQFYIYVAMDNGNNANHRMYVLQGTSTTDPTKPFKACLPPPSATSDDLKY